MVNEELLSVLEYIERERGVDKEILFEAIESALRSAVRKIVGKKTEDIQVEISRDTGEITVYANGKLVMSEEFGRIAAQTAKQVIIQKIREAERDVVYADFQQKVGEIVSGTVHRFDRGDIIIDLGKTEGILPRSQQCRREGYRQGERLRLYVLEVNKGQKGPQIILSRTHPGLVKKLFELEVPEISEGIVEIRGIAREPGERTKISVHSKNEKVDSVGTCVGIRGSRVKNIVSELHNERVDIVRWSEDIKEYARAALQPAEVLTINVYKDRKTLEVIVKDDQLSIAIGKHGQNVRLASKLLDWEIDVRSKSRMKDLGVLEEVVSSAEELILDKLEGVGKKTKEALLKANLDTAQKLKDAGFEGLLKIDGIGKKTAEKIMLAVEKRLSSEGKKQTAPPEVSDDSTYDSSEKISKEEGEKCSDEKTEQTENQEEKDSSGQG